MADWLTMQRLQASSGRDMEAMVTLVERWLEPPMDRAAILALPIAEFLSLVKLVTDHLAKHALPEATDAINAVLAKPDSRSH